MAKVQKQFEQFHEVIKLKQFEENATLREKRNIIRRKLEDRLPGVFAAHGEVCPDFWFRDQGSYELGTGVKPLDGDFDIDQGIYFTLGTSSYPNPVTLKERVYEALNGHTTDVRIRRSCVTVFYQEDGEPIYHVDIAVYADGSGEPDGKPRLAKGLESSTAEYRTWDISDPQALIDAVEDRFVGNDRAQFRRVVRYLKRWRDENFPREGNAAPLGIGLTVAAYHELRCSYTDLFAGTPDDRAALHDLVVVVLRRFVTEGLDLNTMQSKRRLSYELPAEPFNDVFAKMSDTQMTQFEEKLRQLRDVLSFAANAVDPVVASTELQKVFGLDFPVPDPEETAKKHAPAIISSSNSA